MRILGLAGLMGQRAIGDGLREIGDVAPAPQMFMRAVETAEPLQAMAEHRARSGIGSAPSQAGRIEVGETVPAQALHLGASGRTVPEYTLTTLSHETPPQEDADTQAMLFVKDVTSGKSIDAIAAERGLKAEDVIAALKAGGYAVETTAPSAGNGEVRTTEITDPKTGQTVTEVQDRKSGVTRTSFEVDPASGAKKEVSHLADGTVVERTNLADGKVETVVVDAGGKRTVLGASQDASPKGNGPLIEAVGAGKTLEEIARENSLSVDQVRAQLVAAGYTVTTSLPGSPGDLEWTEVRAGNEVVASWHRDWQHDGLTTQRTDAQGSKIDRTVQGDGSIIETATAKDGKVTKTVTAPVPRQPGATTVTETVTAKDGKVTKMVTAPAPDGKGVTVNVTSNGHTLTTGPDGKMTLTVVRDQTGAGALTIEIKPGGWDEALARHLLGLNPGPADQSAIIQTSEIEKIFAGKRLEPELEKAKAPAAPANAAPRTTEETDAANLAEARLAQLYGVLDQANARLNVWTLDPASRAALDQVEADLNKVLSPYGYQWSRPTQAQVKAQLSAVDKGAVQARGALTVAREQLSAADQRLAQVNEAVRAFAEAERLHREAVAMQARLPAAPVTPSGQIVDATTDRVDPDVFAARANAAPAGITLKSTEADYQRLLGYQAMANFNLDVLQRQLAMTAPGSKEAAEVKAQLDALQRQKDALGKFVGATRTAIDHYKVADAKEREALTKLAGLPPAPAAGSKIPELTASGAADQHLLNVDAARAAAARAEAAALFAEANEQRLQGDRALKASEVEVLTGQHQMAVEGSKEKADLKTNLDKAQEDLATLDGQIRISTALTELAKAQGETTRLQPQIVVLQQQLFTAWAGDWLLVEGKEHWHKGHLLGEYSSHEVKIGRDGQLVVEVHYQEKASGEKHTRTFDLSDPLDEKPKYRTTAQTDLNKQWQALLGDPHGVGLQGAQERVNQATDHFKKTLVAENERAKLILGGQIFELNTSLDSLIGKDQRMTLGVVTSPFGAKAAFDGQIAALLKEQSAKNPQGITPPQFAPGTNPIEITIGGQQVLVTAQAAEAFRQGGIKGLAANGGPVGVAIDVNGDGNRELTWFDPTLAAKALRIDLGYQRMIVEQNLRSATAAAHKSSYVLTQPLQVLDDAGTPAYQARLQANYLRDNRQQALDGLIQPRMQELYETNGYDGSFKPVTKQDVARALQRDPASAGIDRVMDEIGDVGGAKAAVAVVPIFYVDEAVGVQQSALFAVKDNDGDTRYVDATGMHFGSIEDFQDNNRQYVESGKLVVPLNLKVQPDANGNFQFDVVKARKISSTDKFLVPVVGISTALAALAVPISGPAAPLLTVAALNGATYLGKKTLDNQRAYLAHGGEWTDDESITNYATIATTFMPTAGNGFRAAHLVNASYKAGSPLTFWQAARGGMGAIGRNPTLINQTKGLLRQSSWMNTIARGADWTSIVTGVPLMGISARDLALHGDTMSILDRANAITGLFSGTAGTALATHSLRTSRPIAVEPLTNTVPAGPGKSYNHSSVQEPKLSSNSKDLENNLQTLEYGNNKQLPDQRAASPLAFSRGQDRKVGRSLKSADAAELQAIALRDRAQELETKARDTAGKVEQNEVELAKVEELHQAARQGSRERRILFHRVSELTHETKKAQAEASKAHKNADRNVPRLEQEAAALDLKAESLRQTPMGKNFVGRDKDLLKWISPDLVDTQSLAQYRATERAAAAAYDRLDTASTKLENAQQRKSLAEAEVEHLEHVLQNAPVRDQLRAAAKLDQAKKRLGKLDDTVAKLDRRAKDLRTNFGDQLVELRSLLIGSADEAVVPAQNGRPALAGETGLQEKFDLVASEMQPLIDAASASKQNVANLKTKLDVADEAYWQAKEAEQAARDAQAGPAEVRWLASQRVSAERAFRDAQEVHRQSLKDDLDIVKLSAQARALKEAVEKVSWQDPQGRNLLPKLNSGKITLGILVSHLAGGVYDGTTGSTRASKVLAGGEANMVNYWRSSFSKTAWKSHNHSSIGAFDLAANGAGFTARKIVENIISRAPWRGAKPLGRKQASDFRADIEQVAQAGNAYKVALEALPTELRDAFPKPNFRLEASFDPKHNASHAPGSRDLTALADRLIANDPAHAGQSRDAVAQDLTARLNNAEASYQKLDAALRTTLNKFPAAVRGYRAELNKLPRELQKLLPQVEEGISIADARKLVEPDAVKKPGDKAVVEKYAADHNVDAGPIFNQFEKAQRQYAEIDKAANGKIDYKAAEKYPTSSMAPNTPIGLGFKSASFGFNFNGLLGWFSKHTPGSNGLGWANHIGFLGHMGVGSYFQARYLQALRSVDNFNEMKPYANRTDEEHKVFDGLDAERKKWNTRNDLAGFASAARSIIQGAAFWRYGMHEAALASWFQGLSSTAWVETQQGSLSRFFSKVSSLAKQDTYKGKGPEIPFTWKSEWNPETGEFGRQRRLPGNHWPQPAGKAREWSNQTKTAARWAAIVSGLAVPTLLYLATSGQLDDMLGTDDFFKKKMTLPPNGDPGVLEAGWDIISNIFVLAAEFEAANSQANTLDDLVELGLGETSAASKLSIENDQAMRMPLTSMKGVLSAGQQKQRQQILASVYAPGIGLPADRVEGEGRRNLDLDGDPRFGSVVVQEPNSVNRIAVAKNVDPAMMVLLNMDHIEDLSLLQPGDLLYFPLV